MEISADPVALVSVGKRLHGMAGDLSSLAGRCTAGGGGTGDPEADAALEAFQAHWSRALDVLAVQVAAYGTTGQLVASAFEQAGG